MLFPVFDGNISLFMLHAPRGDFVPGTKILLAGYISVENMAAARFRVVVFRWFIA